MSTPKPRRSGRSRARLRALGVLLLATAVTAVCAAAMSAGWLAGFQRRATDALQPRGAASDAVAVVAIDPRSISTLRERWPWPRTKTAQLVRRLHEAGAKVVVLDIVLAPESDGDEELARSLRDANNVVIAQIPQLCSSENASTCGPSEHGVPSATELEGPVPALRDAAAATAHAAVTPDPADGSVRTMPLVVAENRRFIPSMALAALALEKGADPANVIVKDHAVQVGSATVPTDNEHRLLISYTRSLALGTYDDGTTASRPIVSATDILSGDADAYATVRNRVVFVGVTDPALGDVHVAPASPTLQPGVLVQANAFNTMMTDAYLTPAASWQVVLAVFVLALVVGLAVQFPRLSIAGALIIVALSCTIGWFLLAADHGTVANLVWPLLAGVSMVPLSGGLRFVATDRQRMRVMELFSQYVPRTVAEELVDRGLAEEAVAGVRADVAALFCDLRGFTSLSATLEPIAVRRMLELFYEYVAAIIEAEDGTLMQFVGDEVFAIFGAPLEFDDRCGRALRAAVAMQERVGELDAEINAIGFSPVRFGIGIHAGEVVAAHVGTSSRRQYTVIGDAINVASRLCSMAGPGQVVISEEVRAGVEVPPEVRNMGRLEMKGVRPDFVAWKVLLAQPPSGSADR